MRRVVGRHCGAQLAEEQRVLAQALDWPDEHAAYGFAARCLGTAHELVELRPLLPETVEVVERADEVGAVDAVRLEEGGHRREGRRDARHRV